jgi:hypothetical protein
VSALTLASDVPPQREYPNLLYNASFETPDWLDPQQAELWNWRPKLTRRDASCARSGQASLRIAGPSRDYNFQNYVSLRPATEYVVSGFVKAAVSRGKGVWLAYLPGNGATAPVRRTDGWQRVERRFTTPAQVPAGMLRIHWDLEDGDVVWLDDLRLEPADGLVPTAPAPVMKPAGGPFRGPVHVELGTDLPGAAFYYTVDGSDPTMFSTPYVQPFRLTGPTTVKARVFHAGHREGAIAEGRFELQPRPGPGVPFSPVGWGQDVEEWWSKHVYNPASPAFFRGPIVSPEPRVNVADIRDAHPESTTGGIEEALAQLPAGGGTLWFPKSRGPYLIRKPPQKVRDYYDLAGPILILRRSHVHFLSDGATVRYAGGAMNSLASANMAGLLNFASLEYADRRVLERPVGDFYFRGLIFDGGGEAPCALSFRHSSEILVEDCEFRHFARTVDMHPGLISGNTVLDNLWVRNCRFLDGKYGFFCDGLHNGGLLNCEFGPDLQGGVLLFTNNDMAPLSASQRSCQYMVIEGCRFAGRGRDAILMTAANMLIQNNVGEGRFRVFVGQTGRGKSNIKHFLRYDGAGIKILQNQVQQADTFVSLLTDVVQHTRRAQRMQNLIRGNRVAEVTSLLAIDPASGGGALNRDTAQVADVLVEGNYFGGRAPQVRVNAQCRDRIRDIRIAGNTFSGASGPQVADLTGKPLEAEGILIEGGQ